MTSQFLIKKGLLIKEKQLYKKKNNGLVTPLWYLTGITYVRSTFYGEMLYNSDVHVSFIKTNQLYYFALTCLSLQLHLLQK